MNKNKRTNQENLHMVQEDIRHNIEM